MEQPTDRKLLESLATASFNESYYRRRADRCARWDLLMRCFSAACGAGAVVTFVAKLDGWSAHAWSALVVTSAVFSVLGPILQLSDHARKWSDIASRWTAVAGGFRQIDRGVVEKEDVAREFCRLVRDGEQLEREDGTGRDNRLARSVQAEITEQLRDRFA